MFGCCRRLTTRASSSRARVLSGRRLRTALIDRVPLKKLTEQAFDGRTTALSYTSQRMFEALGAWDEVEPHAEPILDIHISDAGHDGRASKMHLHFDHREAVAPDEDAAPMGWIVENRHLRAALLQRLAACSSVELIAPDEVMKTTRDLHRAQMFRGGGIAHAIPFGRSFADQIVPAIAVRLRFQQPTRHHRLPPPER